VTRIADSFTWPFRARLTTWIFGIVSILLLPLLFIPLLGYAIAATRSAEQDPTQGPPAWTPSWRLLRDGFWCALVIALSWLPFIALWSPLASVLTRPLGDFAAHVIASLVLALPWGLFALLYFPHSIAAFAASGDRRDLNGSAVTMRRLRGDFAVWNVVVAAIVTGWAIGLAAVGLLCVGIVPGIFYAILVSAHATAALGRPRPRPSPG
jgi:hypothetical protein